MFELSEKMAFYRAEPTNYITNFPYARSGLQNAAFSYIILRREWILELGRDLPIVRNRRVVFAIEVFACANYNFYVNMFLLNIVSF